VGLIHATAYSDDRQVMEYLARELSQLGVRTVQLSPSHVVWRERRAWTQSGEELSAMLRFFPAEWLDELSSNSGWQQFFCAKTPSVNPAQALLSQCKRWPLYWDELGTHVPAWRRLLPQTVDPRDADWQRDASWVLKPAFGRVGDGIGLRGVTSAKDWRRIARSARWFPRFWVAQRRFDIVPVETSLGRVYPTFGVYVINERACGIYARCAASSLIDYRSHEAAVLIEAAAAQPLEVTHVGA
jgi:glutathionylspermidine synthase